MRMTDEELFSVKRAGEVAYKDRHGGQSVIYQSDVVVAGLRAIESEARRRAFGECKEIIIEHLPDWYLTRRGELLEAIERLTEESRCP